MKTKQLPIEILFELLCYDGATGRLTWRRRDEAWFQTGNDPQVRAKIWNTRYAGKPAFTADSHGYRSGAIFHRGYFAHRIAWALNHGEWPEHEIDHINGNRSDNRIVNLRAVTAGENRKNAKMQKRNTSGICGVYWRKKELKWSAGIKSNGKYKHLGSFTSRANAGAARKIAETELGFHPNHGRPS